MSAHLNRSVLQRVREASKKERPAPTRIVPSLAHPYHALPPGKSWVAHNGKKARERTLRQEARKQAKARAKQYGSAVVVGVEPDGALLLDFSTLQK